MGNLPQQVFIIRNADEREICFAIRLRVFVEEQGVPLEIEMDRDDDVAVHFLIFDLQSKHPVGTARLLDKEGIAKIGRFAIMKEARGRGLGSLLMDSILAEATRLGFREAVLDSQAHAVPFYMRCGFIVEGEEFEEAGIPHFRMQRVL